MRIAMHLGMRDIHIETIRSLLCCLLLVACTQSQGEAPEATEASDSEAQPSAEDVPPDDLGERDRTHTVAHEGPMPSFPQAPLLQKQLRTLTMPQKRVAPSAGLSVLFGRVIINSTGTALPEVKVQIPGTDYVSVTDENGQYMFVDIAPGQYELQVGSQTTTCHQTTSKVVTAVADQQIETELVLGTKPKLIMGTLVANYEPMVNGKPLREHMGWISPKEATEDYIEAVALCSGGFLLYEVRGWVNLDKFPVKRDGFQYTTDSYLWMMERDSERHHDPDRADYGQIFHDINLAEGVNSGRIDEVILWGGPWFGYFESAMAGPNRFWINGGTENDESQGINRRVAIMGFNYGVPVGHDDLARMMHSLGHRVESTMRHVFGSWNSIPLHDWDRFTAIQRHTPDQTGCGNIHFPANVIRNNDYEYGAEDITHTSCETYDNWPEGGSEQIATDSSRWGSDQYGYMHWWFGHLPRSEGEHEGKLRNWWRYVFDLNDCFAGVQSNETFTQACEARMPAHELDLSIVAVSSDAQVASRHANEGGATIEHVYGAEASLLLDGRCSQSTDADAERLQLPQGADLLTVVPGIVEQDRYCRMRFELGVGSGDPEGSGQQTNYSLWVTGTRADGTRFAVVLDTPFSFVVTSSEMLSTGEIDRAQIRIDLAQWFSGVELDALSPGANGVVLVDTQSAPAQADRFVSNLANGVSLSLELSESWTQFSAFSPATDHYISGFRMALNTNGDAVGTWTDSMTGTVWASSFAFGTGWSAPIPLSLEGSQSTARDVSINHANQAVSIWSGSGVWTSEYSETDAQWTAPAPVAINGVTDARQVYIDAEGTVWATLVGQTPDTHMVVRKRPGQSWADATRIVTAEQAPDGIALSVNERGQAITAVQLQHPLERERPIVSLHDVNSPDVIEFEVPVSSEASSVTKPTVHMTWHGIARVLWRENHANLELRFRMLEFQPGQWSTPSLHEIGTVMLAAPRQLVEGSSATVCGEVSCASVWAEELSYTLSVLRVMHHRPGTLNTALDVATTGHIVGVPSLVYDKAAQLHMLWQSYSTLNLTRFTYQGFHDEVVQSTASDAIHSTPQLDFDHTGRGLVVWQLGSNPGSLWWRQTGFAN